MFVLPLVKGIHTPFCILLFVKLLNTSGLLFFVNLHEKFQNQITVVCELSLEMFDAVDPLCIILFFQTIQTVFAGLLHPARIQKGKFAGFRNLIEIPVQKWSAQFILCRLWHGCYFKETGINVFDHSADCGTFARCPPAFKKYQHRQLVFFQLHLLLIQLLASFFNPFLQLLFFRNLLRDPGFQHKHVLLTYYYFQT